MKVKQVTLKLPSNFPPGLLHPPVLCCIPNFIQISLSRFPFTFWLTLSKFKKPHKIRNLIISDYFSFKHFKKQPSTPPKIKYKTPWFFQTKQKTHHNLSQSYVTLLHSSWPHFTESFCLFSYP